jgi:site-specific DNA-methyltransferase (adenine-specific)
VIEKGERNRTITLSDEEIKRYSEKLIKLDHKASVKELTDKTIHQDLFEAMDYLPDGFVDLMIVDPPYNLDKNFAETSFKECSVTEYSEWLDSWLSNIVRTLKKTASIYICGDWRSSAAIHVVGQKYFKVQNRITFERDKGRGAKSNWKNNSEDIWFFTVSNDYVFNVEDVKLKRKVMAPYRHENGDPKDWEESEAGSFRLTYPSNIWTDISIPFWSMPENTEHPTQKPEKLIAKLILASSNPGDLVFDPFLGSGTTSATAKKLGRKYLGIELVEKYSVLAEKRLEMAETNKDIQGYKERVFWERNTFGVQKIKRS